MGRPKKVQTEPEKLSSGSKEPAIDPPKYVNKDDFDKLSNRVEKILDVVEKIVDNNKVEPEKQALIVQTSSEDVSDNSQLPLQYQRIFEKYFDPEDGFTARLTFPDSDAKGNEMGGIMFTIVVPNKLSNATKAHLDYYKVDMRSKPLQAGAIANGIENWCKLVASNLKYNRKFKIK
jgi:hypothetical protein